MSVGRHRVFDLAAFRPRVADVTRSKFAGEKHAADDTSDF